ncbi:MAG: Rossmann-like and DUF2520 domain-containing protein [Acutalibacteraceae bacterium]
MKTTSFKIGFIGAGKVGVTLAKYFSERNVCVSGLYDKNYRDAAWASRFILAECFSSAQMTVQNSDIIFITVNDNAISGVWQEIKALPIENKIICHCSGALSSEVFDGIEGKGGYGISLHPLFAVNSKENSYKELSKAMFTVEGSEKGIEKIKKLFENFDNHLQIISKEQKVLYHAAAVFASNLVTAAVHISSELLRACGFDKEQAKNGLMPLFLNNCENIASSGFENALTGPVERNDTETVKKHLDVLKGDEREIYRLLSLELSEIAKSKNPQKDYSETERLLSATVGERQEIN